MGNYRECGQPALGFDGIIHLRQQYAACEQEVHCQQVLGVQYRAL